MDLFIPFKVIAEEGEGRVGENGGIGLALLDELLQLVQLRGVHFYSLLDWFCFRCFSFGFLVKGEGKAARLILG
jgi:hypothetical protein